MEKKLTDKGIIKIGEEEFKVKELEIPNKELPIEETKIKKIEDYKIENSYTKPDKSEKEVSEEIKNSKKKMIYTSTIIGIFLIILLIIFSSWFNISFSKLADKDKSINIGGDTNTYNHTIITENTINTQNNNTIIIINNNTIIFPEEFTNFLKKVSNESS